MTNALSVTAKTASHSHCALLLVPAPPRPESVRLVPSPVRGADPSRRRPSGRSCESGWSATVHADHTPGIPAAAEKITQRWYRPPSIPKGCRAARPRSSRPNARSRRRARSPLRLALRQFDLLHLAFDERAAGRPDPGLRCTAMRPWPNAPASTSSHVGSGTFE